MTDERWERYLERKKMRETVLKTLAERADNKRAAALLEAHGEHFTNGVTYADLLRRGIPLAEIKHEFDLFEGVPNDILLSAETEVRYEGYLKTSEREREKAKKMEEKPLPPDIDYANIDGLHLEAREKLARIRPLNLGQAERISGVNPADIAVLMVYLTLKEHK